MILGVGALLAGVVVLMLYLYGVFHAKVDGAAAAVPATIASSPRSPRRARPTRGNQG